MRYDAIVIGAGPAGGSSALALARQGWSVALIEKSDFPRRKVCGEYMSGTNLAVLDALAIGDAWRAEAGPEIRRVGFFATDVCADAPMPKAAEGFGRALGRDVLDPMLVAAARTAGADIFQPWRAIGIEKSGEAQIVRIDAKGEERQLEAPVVIAAHGSWEPGRLPSNLAKINRPSDLLGFKAHFRDATMAPDLMPMILFPGGYGGIVWADHGRLSISCCIRRDALARARETYGNAAASDALHRHIVASSRGVRDAIGNARLAGPWLASGPIRPGLRACYAEDIFRVGNVAGESQPIIAEGIAMAMQSGWLLAAELARVDFREQAGRELAGARYTKAWRKLFAPRIRAASVFATLAIRPRSAVVMRTVIRALPGVLTVGARLSGKSTDVPAYLTSLSRPAVGST